MTRLLALALLVVATTAGAADLPRVTFVFPTADGGSISADLYGSRDQPAVILAHGAVFDKRGWPGLVPALVEYGRQVLALDFRGYGDSKAGSNPSALYEDLLAAVKLLRERGAPSVTLLGASKGATVAADAATRADKGAIDKLVLISPGTVTAPERVPGPTLVIYSKDEPAAERIRQVIAKLRDPKEVVVLPGTAHAQNILATDQASALIRAIIKFVAP